MPPGGKIRSKALMLLDDMKETLREANGVGLAAPQVGILRRVVIVNIGDEDGDIELINPEIVEASGEQDGPEGCLSCPGEWGMVRRPSHVVVKAQNRRGEFFEITGEELKARAFCHELDHLEGILFKAKASRMIDPSELETEEETRNKIGKEETDAYRFMEPRISPCRAWRDCWRRAIRYAVCLPSRISRRAEKWF